MGILTDDMKRVVNEQQLGFCATVCPDGSPNLSPKGSTRVWDDDHLFFADICSPQTIANLRAGSLMEVNVVDPFVRKGYRFKGRAVICEPGSAGFAEGVERMRAGGSNAAPADRPWPPPGGTRRRWDLLDGGRLSRWPAGHGDRHRLGIADDRCAAFSINLVGNQIAESGPISLPQPGDWPAYILPCSAR